MFYDAFLIRLFRRIIKNSWYRRWARTQVGSCLITMIDFLILFSSRRIRRKKQNVAQTMLSKIEQLERELNTVRQEVENIKKSVHKV